MSAGFTAPRRSRPYFGALLIALREGEGWRYAGAPALPMPRLRSCMASSAPCALMLRLLRPCQGRARHDLGEAKAGRGSQVHSSAVTGGGREATTGLQFVGHVLGGTGRPCPPNLAQRTSASQTCVRSKMVRSSRMPPSGASPQGLRHTPTEMFQPRTSAAQTPVHPRACDNSGCAPFPPASLSDQKRHCPFCGSAMTLV